MVTILQRPYPSIGEQFVSGVTKGAERGFERDEKLRQLQEEAGIKKIQQAEKLQGLLSSDFYKNAPQWQKDLIRAEATEQISHPLAKSLANFQREQLDREDFNRLFGEENQIPYEEEPSQGMITEPGGGFQEEQIPSQKISKSKIEQIPDSKLLQMVAKGGNIGKAAEAEQRRRIENQKLQFKKGEHEYQEAKPTIEYANNLTQSLPQEKQTLEAIDFALKNKDFGFFSRDNLAELTGFEKLRSPEGALFKSGIKEYFLGDVKGVGGKGLNQWLEKQLNDAMLKIGRDNAANEIVKAGFDARYDRKQAWLDEYRKLYKKQKKEQGYISGDIGQEVYENLKPYYEAIQKKLEAEIKAIQKSGQGLSGKMVDIIGPDGFEYEIDERQVGDLPEGWRMK